jgi:RNA recognition motif-containing protein
MAKRLYVGNIPFKTTADELKALFEPHAEIVSIDVVKDRDSGQPRGFAFVEVESGAEAAIEALNGSEMQGRRIVVNEARPKEPRGGGGGGGRRGGGGGWRDR